LNFKETTKLQFGSPTGSQGASFFYFILGSGMHALGWIHKHDIMKKNDLKQVGFSRTFSWALLEFSGVAACFFLRMVIQWCSGRSVMMVLGWGDGRAGATGR